jgi:hypothetical protein
MRNAIGAVTFLWPFMILVRVLGGSPMAMAALLALIPASRSASANASPGWIGGSFSVVIRDFDILRLVVLPAKTNREKCQDQARVSGKCEGSNGPPALSQFRARKAFWK